MVEEIFIKYSCDKFRQHCTRIEDCLGRLSYENVWMRHSENENSIGNLVLHLCGNVSQWILSGVGAQPDLRDRDQEFAARAGMQPEELAGKLRQVITDAIEVLRGFNVDRLSETRRIQKYEVTVLEAIYHVVEHFAGHAGQIIFATKLFTAQDLGYYKHLSKPVHNETVP